MHHSRRSLVALASALAMVGAGVYACGSRTGLVVVAERDGGNVIEAGPHDATIDSPHDAGRDVGHDADADAKFDAPAPPPIILGQGCDASQPNAAYFMTIDEKLGTFDPETLIFSDPHKVSCPVFSTEHDPHTIAVNRAGMVFVLYNDDNIYEIDPRTYACTSTPYKSGQMDYPNRFGMAFRWLQDGGDELRLLSAAPSRLAIFDPVSFKYIDELGVHPDILSIPDLQATPDGGLFAFDKTYLVGLDLDSGAMIYPDQDFPNLELGPWTFLAWRGRFILFDAPGPLTTPSNIRVYDPVVMRLQMVGKYPTTIVGVAASTCLN